MPPKKANLLVVTLPDPRGWESEYKNFGGRIVALETGPTSQIFNVHEDLLAEHSPFFEAAIKKEWIEARYRHIPLPDDDPQVVSLYVHWIYTGRILSRPSDPTSEEEPLEIELLVDAFVFGEKIQDGRFQDAVIDAAIKSTCAPSRAGQTWYPGVTAVNRAYAGTLSASPLRRLMVDFWARNAQESWDRKGFNVEFLTDLVGELLTRRDPFLDPHPSDGKTSTCSYHHHHGDDHLCYSKSRVA